MDLMEQIRKVVEAKDAEIGERIERIHREKYGCETWGEQWTETLRDFVTGKPVEHTFTGCRDHRISW